MAGRRTDGTILEPMTRSSDDPRRQMGWTIPYPPRGAMVWSVVYWVIVAWSVGVVVGWFMSDGGPKARRAVYEQTIQGAK
jgi:hypothetical protein